MPYSYRILSNIIPYVAVVYIEWIKQTQNALKSHQVIDNAVVTGESIRVESYALLDRVLRNEADLSGMKFAEI